jgi:hypothetical protein
MDGRLRSLAVEVRAIATSVLSVRVDAGDHWFQTLLLDNPIQYKSWEVWLRSPISFAF